MNDTVEQPAAPKKRGWPAGKPRGPRAESQRAPQRQMSGRTRTGRVKFNDDIYYIDRSTLPEHMDYQWVTKSVMGDETGRYRADMVKFQMNGWEAVDGSMVPQYGIVSGEVNINGLVLMQRPMEMTEEARAEDIARARGQVQAQIASLDDDSRDIRKGNEAVARKPRAFGRGEPIAVRGDDTYENAE